MSQFTSPLIGEWNDEMTKFKVVEPFVFYKGYLGSSEVIQVPKGFTTDFASTPQALKWLVPPVGRYGKAAVLHDYLYEFAIGSKAYADDTFYEAMLVLKVPKWKAKVLYLAVKYFGKGNYK